MLAKTTTYLCFLLLSVTVLSCSSTLDSDNHPLVDPALEAKKYIISFRELAQAHKALPLFVKSCNNFSNADSCLTAGVIYHQGLYRTISKPDHKKAHLYFKKAYKLGQPKSKYYLGSMYFKGKGVNKNEAKGLELLNSASTSNDVDAIMFLGNLYSDSSYQDYNLEKAESYFIKAIENNYSPARSYLGRMYLDKYPNGEKINEGVVMLMDAMTLNKDPTAAYRLGGLFFTGNKAFDNGKTFPAHALAYFKLATALGLDNQSVNKAIQLAKNTVSEAETIEAEKVYKVTLQAINEYADNHISEEEKIDMDYYVNLTNKKLDHDQ